MIFKNMKDRKIPMTSLRENCVDSTKIMEKAYQNIMDEIIEYVIEGLCFEAHRAVKRDYFSLQEYMLKEHAFYSLSAEDGAKETPELVGDIFANDINDVEPEAVCSNCKQRKAASKLITHMLKCRQKSKGSSNAVDDGNKNDGKKGNDAKSKSKSTPNYESMSLEEKKDFLLTYCGVVSNYTGRPCNNKINCKSHSEEDKLRVREIAMLSEDGLGEVNSKSPSSFLPSSTIHFADDNIDPDTVD